MSVSNIKLVRKQYILQFINSFITFWFYSLSEQFDFSTESMLMPTSEYRAGVEFEDYYNDKLQIQCCRLIWTAQYNFKWSSCNACCPVLAIFFRKCMEYCYQTMAGALITHLETKKEK